MADILSVIYDDVEKIIASWKNDDIYAISFFVYDKDDNPSTPTLTVGHNTMEQTLSGCLGASSPGEAKWSYACWLQNEEYVFGYDDKTSRLIKDWAASLGLSNGTITEAFVNTLVEISLKLHNNGVITNAFVKEIPIIIHELEYYETIALQNKKANPSGAISEFLQWMYDEELNPQNWCNEKNNVEPDINSPGLDMEEYMDNPLKYFKSIVKKMAEDGTLPADRWEEYKAQFPDADE